jgi:hypothetical protein
MCRRAGVLLVLGAYSARFIWTGGTTHPPSIFNRRLPCGLTLHRIYLMFCEYRFQYSYCLVILRDRGELKNL